MENLYYNLSEEEFTKGRKVLLWIFAAFFFLGGLTILVISTAFGHKKSIPAVLSLVPFGISFVVSSFAFFASIKRKDLFFLVDNEKLEFRYGVFHPKRHSYNWNDVKELIVPHRQKKVKIVFKDDSFVIIDLTWLKKEKSNHIKVHIYHTAREKDIKVIKVINL